MSRRFRLRSYEFRREREGAWVELEALVERVERQGIRSLSASQLSRLPMLYQGALSSLSVARSISLDLNLLSYLESLTARAYFCVYGTKRHIREIFSDFFRSRFCGTVRRFSKHIALAGVFFLLGVACGMALTLEDPEHFYSLVPADQAQGRTPSAGTEDLRAALYDRTSSATDRLMTFATFLFTRNAKIGMLCFVLGFLAGVPVFLLLFSNGLSLGSFAGLYYERGLSLEFWGWVLPHGVMETLAVLLCGGAGLMMAEALLFPGRQRRLAQLARRGREAGVLVFGAVLLLFVAGLLEGLFRQSVQNVAVRYSMALVTVVFLGLYFGRKPAPDPDEPFDPPEQEGVE